MVTERLGVSQWLKNHPILSEKATYKIKYLNVLEYFTRKYSREDIFATAILDNYKEFLMKDIEYTYEEQLLKKAASGVVGYKFKGFKLFTYRYALIMDCLFINAFADEKKAELMVEELKSIFKQRYHLQIDKLFGALYGEESYSRLDNMINFQAECWKRNRAFEKTAEEAVLITANMSAGKSTLINALVGKKINRTQNDACTSKIHYIINKPFEDGFNYKLDKNLILNADEKRLLKNDEDNKSNYVAVGTYFRSNFLSEKRFRLIDTPGVNSSMNPEHTNLTYNAIGSEEFNKVVYVINGEQIGTEDDRRHLEYIFNKVKKDKVIFVLNKLDSYRSGEDSVEETVNNLQEDLKEIGFTNFRICPVSAYAGFLAKKYLFEDDMDEDEIYELKVFMKKFKKPEYNLAQYHKETISSEDLLGLAKGIQKEEKIIEGCLEVLHKAGILNLEHLLSRE